jgi:hypothetical protein
MSAHADQQRNIYVKAMAHLGFQEILCMLLLVEIVSDCPVCKGYQWNAYSVIVYGFK